MSRRVVGMRWYESVSIFVVVVVRTIGTIDPFVLRICQSCFQGDYATISDSVVARFS